MRLPEINFYKIRPHQGSRNIGLQVLITQLARDNTQATERFVVKGPGADGGIECYSIAADLSETGWQVKLVPSWDAAASQFTSSFKKALDSHPNLKTFIVCVPFDLSDSRDKNKKTSKAKYDDWKAARLKEATDAGLSISIEFWGASEILERLKQGPHASERITYWFNETVLNDAQLSRHFRHVKSAIGDRYDVDNHQGLAIEKSLLGACRGEAWRRDFAQECTAAVESVTSLFDALDHQSVSASKFAQSNTHLASITDLWRQWTDDRTAPFPAAEIAELTRAALDALSSDQVSLNDDALPRVCRDKLQKARFDVQKLLAFTGRQLTHGGAHQCVLLSGEGGSGKSHLLARVAERCLQAGGIAVMVYGGGMSPPAPPWSSVVRFLDDASLPDTETFLGAMNAAAAARGERALICIDAINEGSARSLWPDGFERFLNRLEDYPHIFIIISCRTTELDSVLPNLDTAPLAHIEHLGYGGTGGRATQRYIESRGLTRNLGVKPGANLDNPLILKLVCDRLVEEKLTEFPAHLEHITGVFDFILGALYKKINKALKFDAKLNRPRKALEAFALAAIGDYGYLDYEVANDLIHEHGHSSEDTQNSLLRAFIGAGILTEITRKRRSDTSYKVHFTFERLGDFVAGSALLREGLDSSGRLVSGSLLDRLLNHGEETPRISKGIYDAILLILADDYHAELTSLAPRIFDDKFWKQAFRRTLPQRPAQAMSDETVRIAESLMNLQELSAVAIGRIGISGDRLNPVWLNSVLSPLDMIERDLSWSLGILSPYKGAGSALVTLFDWIETADISTFKETLATDICLVLSWALTTSNREIRDKATKALVRVVSLSLARGTALLETFENIDTPYVQERLYAVCYGAALQRNDTAGLTALAEQVYERVFKQNAPPSNLLLRDHAISLMNFAVESGAFDASYKPYLGPYNDSGPLEYVPRDWKPSSNEKDYQTDSVKSSIGEMGDFGSYIVRPFVTQWSPASKTVVRLPSDRDRFEAWLADFISDHASLTPAWTQFDQFISDWNAKGRQNSFHYDKDWNQQLTQFETAIGRDAYLKFEEQALPFARHGLHSAHWTSSPDCFQSGTAGRWIWKRVWDMGYTSAAFEAADRGIGSGRMDHRAERLSKKYQWLAFYELGARLQDHHALISQSWTGDRFIPVPFELGYDVGGVRNIDPSLLKRATHYDGWAEWRDTWWSPQSPELPVMNPREQLDWLHANHDFIAGENLIDLTDPQDGSRWLSLSTFTRVSEKTTDDETGSISWCRTQCYVVPKGTETQAITALQNRLLLSSHDLVEGNMPYWAYIGELNWNLDDALLDAGIETTSYSFPSIEEIRATSGQYLRETSGYDHSIDETIGIEVPLPWLMKATGALFAGGDELNFIDEGGEVIFRDPSTSHAGPSNCLVKYEAFMAALEAEELVAVWVQAGSKEIHAGERRWGGDRSFTRIYTLDGDNWTCRETLEMQWPQKDALTKFLGPDDVPNAHDIARFSRKRPVEERNDQDFGIEFDFK